MEIRSISRAGSEFQAFALRWWARERVLWRAVMLALTMTPWLWGVGQTDAAAGPLFEVPRLSGVQIDGEVADWQGRGLRVGILTTVDGQVFPADDLNAEFRLGWDDRGLLLALTVADDTAHESPDEGALWTMDSVELFVADRQGAAGHYQVLIAPGLDPRHPRLRHAFTDQRRNPDTPLQVEAARTRTGGGYILEALLPWSNLGISPHRGAELGFQIYVNDTDGGSGYPSGWKRLAWFPRGTASSDPTATHRLRLAERAGEPVLAVASGQYEYLRRAKVQVYAVAELAGKEVEIREDGRRRVRGELVQEGVRSQAQLILPVPPRGSSFGKLEARIDGKTVATIDLPPPDERRARELMDIEVFCRPSVFSGPGLPECGPTQPSWVEDLIGPYQVKTTFYDSQYQSVTTAQHPGRYGAVIELIPQTGRPVRRFRTLFRHPEELQWWNVDLPVQVELPAQLGISSQVVHEHSRVVREQLKWRLVDGFWRDDRTAALLAGLYETAPGDPDPGVAGDVWARDRQWWVGLKRRLNEMDAAFSAAFVCPRPLPGPPAPVVRQGSLEEAGMRPGAAARLDSLLREWAAVSGEGFAVCIVRHGVIVLHQAYGQRDGRPMTVDDPSWMASITKLLSGTLMMMLVDQGLVDLEDRVDAFLPELRGIDVSVPLTIRHLYIHTNGLWGHWGDDLNDFEAIVADYYPHLQVGQRHDYNGAGYSLGGKVIEAVTGIAVPQFYKQHLLGPLGCTNTHVTDTSGGARSVPLDMARIGQMLLNRGVYGGWRFFSEETFARMLPVRLTQVLGPETAIEWGIGTTWYRQDGLGEGTFGHGAASSATLRIDPANDLVIVMTRNTGGPQFGEYHPRFLAAIVEGIE